ncbi:MAG: Fic family protein, partial [Limnohabitans sp.]|nr:Fic family protein [Limnohabitans sp.]
MPRPTPTQELDSLLELIVTAADDLGIDTIAQQWGTPIHRRTLQRRLALLVAQQRIEMLGDRRTARYRRTSSAAIHAQEPEADWRVAPPADDLPVSEAGAEVRAYVTQPRYLRNPVAYRPSFLEQYQPNQTAYLPLDLREQLHTMGRSPAAQTPAGTFARDMLNRLLIDLSWA